MFVKSQGGGEKQRAGTGEKKKEELCADIPKVHKRDKKKKWFEVVILGRVKPAVWSAKEKAQLSPLSAPLQRSGRGIGHAVITFLSPPGFFLLLVPPPSPPHRRLRLPLLKFIHNVPGQNRQTIFAHFCGFSETPNQTLGQQMIS